MAPKFDAAQALNFVEAYPPNYTSLTLRSKANIHTAILSVIHPLIILMLANPEIKIHPTEDGQRVGKLILEQLEACREAEDGRLDAKGHSKVFRRLAERVSVGVNLNHAMFFESVAVTIFDQDEEDWVVVAEDIA